MTTEAAAGPKALAEWHASRGARLGEVAPGIPAVLGYGSLEAEVTAATEGCALADRGWVSVVDLLGKDRARFLDGFVTCPVAALAAGEGTYGFLPDARGKILADAAILAREDRLRLLLPPGRAEGIAAHLAKYVIVERVEPRVRDDLCVFTLVGPRAGEILDSLGVAVPEGASWHSAPADLAEQKVLISGEAMLGRPGFTCWTRDEAAAEVLGALLEEGREGGVRLAGLEALEVVRVEAGIPRWGADYGGDNFPQETGLEEAVSHDKGCYLGQEVIARIHYRGHVNHSLRGLHFEGEEPPARGTFLSLEGRRVGEVGSAVRSFRAAAAVGLAVLHRRAGEPGTRLDLEGGGSAVVADLPPVPGETEPT